MTPPTDVSLNSLRRRLDVLTRGVVLVTIVAATEARLEPVRWWSSPRVVSAIGITPQQAVAIERLYEDSLPAWRNAGEDVVNLTERVARLVRAGKYHDEPLLHLTSELVQARSIQCELHRQMLERTTRPLWPEQRTRLARFMAQKGVR